MDNSTIIVGDFETPLSRKDRIKTRQKDKGTEDLNNTINLKHMENNPV